MFARYTENYCLTDKRLGNSQLWLILRRPSSTGLTLFFFYSYCLHCRTILIRFRFLSSAFPRRIPIIFASQSKSITGTNEKHLFSLQCRLFSYVHELSVSAPDRFDSLARLHFKLMQSVSDTGILGKNEFSPVEPMTFWLLVQMLKH